MSGMMSDESKTEDCNRPSARNRGLAVSTPSNFNIGHVLGITALLAPVIGFVAPNGLAALLAISALAALVAGRLRDRRWPSPPVGLVILIAILIGWAMLSAVWSINSTGTLSKLPRFALLLMAGLVIVDAALRLDSDHRNMVFLYLATGLAIGLFCMVLDRVTGGHIRQLITGQVQDGTALLNTYNRSATVFVLFVWPLTMRLARIHILAIVALWLLVLGVVLSLLSSAAVFAHILGGIGFAFVALTPRIGCAVISALFVLSILGAPALPPSQTQAARLLETYEELPRSWYHRMLIGRFVADRIFERPLLGWGFDSSRDIPGRETQVGKYETALPLHPHNAALQWWLELGAPGAILGAALVIWLMRAIGRARATIIEKASAASLVLSTVTVSFLSYGIWQSWWLATIWLAGAFMVALIGPAPAESEPEST
jgi:O-antigen ligase